MLGRIPFLLLGWIGVLGDGRVYVGPGLMVGRCMPAVVSAFHEMKAAQG